LAYYKKRVKRVLDKYKNKLKGSKILVALSG
jgi:tRNA(Ile)-lysidine synthase TilS/MesJ